MNDFSLDLASERIVDQRSKKYFEEVLSDYNSGNYRSAVVMLWSVVVCDLLFKLEQLRSAYADPVATAILNEVEATQRANPRSPEWEAELVQQVRDRTSLLDTAEYSNLSALQQHRHLSAHPVLTGSYELYSPNRETVRAHIRNALEATLLKPAMMSKKVFDSFVTDLSAATALLPDDASLKRYLDAKYFARLTLPVEKALFRSLWRVTFRTTAAEAEQNRTINYRALRLLYQRHPTEFQEAIHNEPSYYSDVHAGGTPLPLFLRFLSDFPPVFGVLDEAARTLARNYAQQNPDIYLTAWFLGASVQEHLGNVRMAVVNGGLEPSPQGYQNMVTIATDLDALDDALAVGTALYGSSLSYNTADVRFQAFIAPYLQYYSATQMLALLNEIEENDQTYGRARATRDHARIKATADEVLGVDFDYTRYEHFLES